MGECNEEKELTNIVLNLSQKNIFSKFPEKKGAVPMQI